MLSMLRKLILPQEALVANPTTSYSWARVSRSIRVVRECMAVTAARTRIGFHTMRALEVAADGTSIG